MKAVRRTSVRIALCALVMTAPAAVQAQSVQPVAVDMELVLAVDVSGSIDEQEATLQRQGYVDAFAHPEVIAAIGSGMLRRIAVTYFEWAGDGWQLPVADWTVIESEADARGFAARLASAPVGSGPWTSISSAIDFAVPLFDGNGIESARRVLDISGDGPNNTGRLAPQARDGAVARGIVINGLPIMNNRIDISRPPMPNLDLYFRNCVIGGPGAFIVVAENFRTFADAIRRKLVLEIAGLPTADGPLDRKAHGRAQARPGAAEERWIPPCDVGERRFRGFVTEP